MKRLITIEIEHPDKDTVDRFADLIADELRLTITFMQATREYFGTTTTAPSPTPTIEVRCDRCAAGNHVPI